jgi:hypothetical protein
VRIVLLSLIALSLVGLVIGAASRNTGGVELVVLAALAAVLLAAAAQIRRRLA